MKTKDILFVYAERKESFARESIQLVLISRYFDDVL